MTRELVAFQDALTAQNVASRFIEASIKTHKTASVQKPLYGHDSMSNAYVVDDYPYGFRLRCKIRYWVEYVPKKGYRMVSQTTNPKIADREVWNKPKATTYAGVAGCLYLDSKDQVHFATLTPYDTADKCLEFADDFPKYDFKLLGKWAVMKLELCYKFITGKVHFTINDVKQETSDADKGRYRAEAETWSKLAKKLHASYPDFVGTELGL
jgi:hypothetical protein